MASIQRTVRECQRMLDSRQAKRCEQAPDRFPTAHQTRCHALYRYPPAPPRPRLAAAGAPLPKEIKLAIFRGRRRKGVMLRGLATGSSVASGTKWA